MTLGVTHPHPLHHTLDRDLMPNDSLCGPSSLLPATQHFAIREAEANRGNAAVKTLQGSEKKVANFG